MSDDFRTGTLYLVSTPIGNLEDITLRALRILKEVDIVAAEDSRRTGLLLKHFNIKSALESYHDYNKEKKTPHLLNLLSKGRTIAVVSDAGTPGISDPAYYLVKRAVQTGITVSPVPGATAVVASLIVSGLPTDRFVFDGFLPPKKGRKTRLEQLKGENRTLILYEAPHRLVRTLNDLLNVFGNRHITVCREMTKKFEEIIRGTLTEIIAIFSQRDVRGEIVLVIEGCEKK